jgi:hypothetical protein
MVNSKQKQGYKPGRRSPWSRIGRIFSWMAGISFGSLGLLILLLLIATAIFVRTSLFQNYLRDQVVSAVQDELGAEIQYREANLKIFRFYPELEFNEVSLSDEATKVEVQIERVAISVNAFVTIPLLFFRTIHISSASVSGLKYELTDADVIDEWLGRLQPQESEAFIPSRFNTVIGEIRFKDFELGIDLKKTSNFPENLAAKLHLREFDIEFEDNQIYLDGTVSVNDLNFQALSLEEAELQLDGGMLSDDRFSFVRVLVQSKEDRFQASGSLERFQAPVVDLEVQLDATLHQYLRDFPLEGYVESKFQVGGPVSDLQGEGQVSVTGVKYKKRQFESLRAKWSLDFPVLELESLQLRSGSEKIDATGRIGLNASIASNLRIGLSGIPIGKYVGTVDYGVQNWRGDISGELQVQGDLLFDGEKQLRSQLEVDGFQIRTWESDNLILSLGAAEVSAQAQIGKDWAVGSMQGEAKTNGSSWDVNMDWSPDDFLLEWDGRLNGERLGQLYMFDLKGVGEIDGSYGGLSGKPFRLEVRPRLRKLVLNGQRIDSSRGLLSLEHRRMHAEPITAKQFEITGGLYFPKGAEVQFSELEFKASDLNLAKVLGSFDGTNDWPIQLDGLANANGILVGSVDSPTGRGVLGVNNLVVASEGTRGRLFKANWEFVPGLFRMKNIYLETSSESGGVRGSVDINLDGIQAFDFTGTKLRWADWALLPSFRFKQMLILSFRTTEPQIYSRPM